MFLTMRRLIFYSNAFIYYEKSKKLKKYKNKILPEGQDI